MTEEAFHAHIYYRTPAERAAAERVRSAIEAGFAVRMGRWRDEPVGPHPVPMFQVAFAADIFATIVPWMMLHRERPDHSRPPGNRPPA